MGRLTIAGRSFEIGGVLGRFGRPLARHVAYEVRCDAFCCRLRETEMTVRQEQVRERFTHLWEERRGMSVSMGLDIA